jgi:hypothetical protein
MTQFVTRLMTHGWSIEQGQVLERMERAGKVARMVEVSGTRTGGRPAPRWTSNADNMSTQRRLGVLAMKTSDDDDDNY